MNASRVHDNNTRAQLAQSFNDFYLRITSPQVQQIGNYQIIEEIGEGAFGKVYLAKHVMLDVRVVLKCGLIDDPNIVREIFYHRHLKHKHIVKLFEVVRTEKHLWMVQEYCEGNELYYYVYEKRRIEYKKCRKLFFQIVCGVRYVHSLNLAHRDLKLENILLADTKRTTVKLTDFGFVREFDCHKRQFLSTICGTTVYMAPELIKNEQYSGFAIDIWALGVILFTLLYGEMPFEEDDILKTKFKIVHEEPHYRNDIPEGAIDLMKQMLSKDPRFRPTIIDVLNSSFLSPVYDRELKKRRISSNDTESVKSLTPLYTSGLPFQSKPEKLLLRRLKKLDISVSRLVDDLQQDRMTPLTALFELGLFKEQRSRKMMHYKRNRYKDARKSLRNSRQRMKSVLSLDQMSGSQPLDRIMSSLSLNNTRHSITKSNIPGLVHRDTDPDGSKIVASGYPDDETGENEDIPSEARLSKQNTGRTLTFENGSFKKKKKAESRRNSESRKSSKNSNLLNKLQFWKKKTDIDTPSELTISVDSSNGESPLQAPMAEKNDNSDIIQGMLNLQTNPNVNPSPFGIDGKIAGKTRALENESVELSPTYRPPVRHSSSLDLYIQKNSRTRPPSVISQASQISKLSQHSTILSESDLAAETDTETESEFEGLYDSSIDTSHYEAVGLRQSSSLVGSTSKPSHSSHRTHGRRVSSDNSNSSQTYFGRRSLSKLSSNSSDESYSVSSRAPESPKQGRFNKESRNNSIIGTDTLSRRTLLYPSLAKLYQTVLPHNDTCTRRAHSPPLFPKKMGVAFSQRPINERDIGSIHELMGQTGSATLKSTLQSNGRLNTPHNSKVVLSHREDTSFKTTKNNYGAHSVITEEDEDSI